jgi:MFS family permease
MAFLLNGLGSVLAPLQRDLHVSRGDVAFYPSLFAAGLVVVGFTGGALVSRIGRTAALRMAIAGMMLGGLLLATPFRAATLIGALLLGLGGAILVQLGPALLAALHPQAPTAAVGEANALASAASVIAPLAVSAALVSGLGWRFGYLGPVLLALAILTVPAWRMAMPEAPAPTREAQNAVRVPLFGPWADVLVAVSVEFCFIFWAPSALIEWDHASLGQAPALASLFLVGMATARGLSAPITRRLRGTRVLMLTCAAVAAVGFVLFWAAPTVALAAVGLLVAGIGVALLYPTTVSRVVAVWPHAPDRAAAWAALASGLAIGVAPFVLARLSDLIGLRWAYLIVPTLLLILAARGVVVEKDRGLRLPSEYGEHVRPDKPRA